MVTGTIFFQNSVFFFNFTKKNPVLIFFGQKLKFGEKSKFVWKIKNCRKKLRIRKKMKI